MKRNFQFQVLIAAIYLIAWIAKMHFIPGGDILIRLATMGWCLLLIWQVIRIKDQAIKRIFNINTPVLILCFLGIMLKVSHVFAFQIYKDLLLDFLGYPAMLVAIAYNCKQVSNMCDFSREAKVILVQQLLFPWIMLWLTFLLYSLYSSILLS